MKNSYILLRNNKESNALTIEELQKIGLQKDDLIWVECQSMDWRSPFEIAELKNLVLSVNTGGIKKSSEEVRVQEAPYRDDPSREQVAEKILTDPDIKKLEKYSHPELAALSGLEKKEMDPLAKSGSSTSEKKRGPLTNPVPKRQRKNSVLAIQLSEPVKKMALYSGLVLMGAMMMLLIEKFGGKREDVVQPGMPSAEKNSSSITIVPADPDKNSTISAAKQEAPGLLTGAGPASLKEEPKKPAKTANDIPLKTTANVNLETQDISTNNDEKNTRPAAVINVKPVSIEDIMPKIALKANDYNVGFLGGIRDLTMTLQNDTRYMLDKVTAEIKYLNQNGKVINTEQLYFQNVKSGEAASLPVNKSKRGVKVEYEITNIECKELTGHQPGLPDPGHYSTN